MTRSEHARQMGLARRDTGKDWSGTRFTRVLILHRGKRRGRTAYWQCQCDCGNLFESQLSSLRYGKTKSCGCLIREMTKARFNIRTLQNQAVRYLKQGAKDRNLSVLLSDDKLIALMEKECYYCGVFRSNRIKERGYTWEYNGIDRFDNSKGYEENNCVPCCKDCNRSKSAMTSVEFFDFIRRIYKKHSERIENASDRC